MPGSCHCRFAYRRRCRRCRGMRCRLRGLRGRGEPVREESTVSGRVVEWLQTFVILLMQDLLYLRVDFLFTRQGVAHRWLGNRKANETNSKLLKGKSGGEGEGL